MMHDLGTNRSTQDNTCRGPPQTPCTRRSRWGLVAPGELPPTGYVVLHLESLWKALSQNSKGKLGTKKPSLTASGLDGQSAGSPCRAMAIVCHCAPCYFVRVSDCEEHRVSRGARRSQPSRKSSVRSEGGSVDSGPPRGRPQQMSMLVMSK